MGKSLTPDEKETFLEDIPALYAIKSQLYNHRRKFIPKAPQSFCEFDRNLSKWFDGLEIGDTTLSDGRRVVMLSSKKSLEYLARSDCIAMDGTFKINPSPWKQVGIISAEISNECWIPVAFGLLPDKKRDTYDAFFV